MNLWNKHFADTQGPGRHRGLEYTAPRDSSDLDTVSKGGPLLLLEPSFHAQKGSVLDLAVMLPVYRDGVFPEEH